MSRVIINDLYIKGFSCIREAVIPIHNADLCCIEGRILDPEMSKDTFGTEQLFNRSNGAGKSSIVEAFYFGLTGEFFDTDTTLGSIVNRFTGSVAEIAILGSVDEKSFVINRSVESKTKRTASRALHKLEFIFDGEKIHEQTNSLPQTQERINELLGINSLLLLNSKIFGQGDISSFTNVNDRQKKVIIDNLVGVGTCDKLCKSSKSLLSETATAITTIKVQAMSKHEHMARVAKEIQYLAAKETQWEHDRKKELAAIDISIDELNKENTALEDTIRDLSARKDQLGHPIEKRALLREQLQEAEGITKLIDQNLQDASEEKNRTEKETNFHFGRLRSTDDKVAKLKELYESQGSLCPTCYQELSLEAFKKVVTDLQEERDELDKRVKVCEAASLKASDTYMKYWRVKEDTQTIHNGLRAKLEEAEAVIRECQTADTDIERCHAAIEANNKQIKVYVQQKCGIDEQVSPYTELYRSKQAELENTEYEIKKMEGRISELEIDQRYFNFLVRAFDKGGIPQLISSDVLKILNKILTNYKNRILGDKFKAEYTMKERRGNEEISLELMNPVGGEGYSRQSKGEKRKIDLCQMFTISDFAKMQNKCNLNVIWFDEIFSELDPHSCESVLDIIRDYPAASKFIITHKDLFKDAFKNRIYVEKSGALSTVRTNYN